MNIGSSSRHWNAFGKALRVLCSRPAIYAIICLNLICLTLTLHGKSRPGPLDLGPDTYCTEQKMTFYASEHSKLTKADKSFDCSLWSYLQKFDLLGSTRDVNQIEPSEVVFVSYASSNHYDEARKAINDIRNLMPNKIVFYDIGLHESQVDVLKTVCNLEYVKFNFSAYPSFVENLGTYSFKPLIVAEMYVKYNAFWVLDTSVEFMDKDEMEKFYANVLAGRHHKFTVEHPSGHSIVAATQPAMYSYLPISKEQSYQEMYQALTMFIVKSPFSTSMMKWWVLCALTEDCIAPQPASLYCSFQKDSRKSHAGCHRFDQSALSIILTAVRDSVGDPLPAEIPVRGAFSPIATVERGHSFSGDLPTEC